MLRLHPVFFTQQDMRSHRLTFVFRCAENDRFPEIVHTRKMGWPVYRNNFGKEKSDELVLFYFVVKPVDEQFDVGAVADVVHGRMICAKINRVAQPAAEIPVKTGAGNCHLSYFAGKPICMKKLFDRFSAFISVNRRTVITLLFLFTALAVFASAGGGGGGGGGSDSDDGGFVALIIYIIIELLPFPYNLIAFALLIFFGYLANRKRKTRSGLNSVPSFYSIDHQVSAVPPDFMQRNPGFDQQQFFNKVGTAFNEIQLAWMNQDLSKVRRWISDGVWQRFHTQFVMMQALGQRNTMSDIRIQKLVIDQVHRDGNYDIIDVGIHFTMEDNFITDKFPELNQEGFLENVEYWSFIRKSGVKEKDMFHSQNCPNCGGQLPEKTGEVSRCEHCGTITTLGDYDWVLAEITQSVDHANESAKFSKDGTLTQKIRQAIGNDPEFSVQFVEDKASNAYMQIMSAMVMQKPERMRRFTGDPLYEQLGAKIKANPPFVFNRLYLNNVTLMDFYQHSGKDHLVLSFRRSSQRVDISGGKLMLIDAMMYTTNEVMILSRDTGAGRAKGSLYAHSCPSCGGPVGDTIDLNCSYCGAQLNSTKTEWIVTQLMDNYQYKSFMQQLHAPLTTGAGEKEIDPLYKVRDYAFNNVMMIVMADGHVSQQEIDFVNRLASKLGYDSKKLAGIFEMARNRQLVLRLPEERQKAEKVFSIMEKAAHADGHLDPREDALLADVRRHIEAMH